MLACIFAGCGQLSPPKPIIWLDTARNKESIRKSCERALGCSLGFDRTTALLEKDFATAFQENRDCESVTLSKDVDVPMPRWELSLNGAIQNGQLDESDSTWSITDSPARKRSLDGNLRDMDEAAARICRIATGKGGTVIQESWNAEKTIETWFIRDPSTRKIEQRNYTLAQAIAFCKENPKMEIATQTNASANAFTICPAFVSEF
jgi:hypothetical protein